MDYRKSIKKCFSNNRNLVIGCLFFAVYIVAIMVAGTITSFFSYFVPYIISEALNLIITSFITAIPIAYMLTAAFAKKLPSWLPLDKLFQKGFNLGVVILVYSIPMAVVMALLSSTILGADNYEMLFSEEFSEMSDEQVGQFFMGNIVPKLPIFLPVIIAFSVLWSMISTSAEILFFRKRKLSDAFDLGLVLALAFSPAFIKATLQILLISLVLLFTSAITCLLLVISILGIIVIPFYFAFVGYILFLITYDLYVQALKETKL